MAGQAGLHTDTFVCKYVNMYCGVCMYVCMYVLGMYILYVHILHIKVCYLYYLLPMRCALCAMQVTRNAED